MSNPHAEDRRRANLEWLYGRTPPAEEEIVCSKLVDDFGESTPSDDLHAKAIPTSVTWSEEEMPARPQSSSPTSSRVPSSARPSREELRVELRVVDAPRPTPSPPHEETPPAKKSKKGRRIVRALRILLLLFLTWLVFLIGTALHAWSTTTVIDAIPKGIRPSDQPGTTFLLVGTDAREGLTQKEKERLGTGDAAGTRTDTMMVLHVPDSGRPVLISLPRDSYLTIPGKGKNKLNAAYAFGGPSLLTATVENATGLRIDGYIEIGFAGFANVVDAVNGVEICLDQPMIDHDSNTNLPAGCQKLNGAQALGYVRMRKADPRGDIGRIERQRQMISAIAKKAASPMTLVNPFRYWKLTHALASNIRRSKETDLLKTLPLASASVKFANGNALNLTVPISNPNAPTSAGSSVLWDDKAAREMFTEIAKGDTSQLDRFVKK